MLPGVVSSTLPDLDERRLLPRLRDRTRMLREQARAVELAVREADEVTVGPRRRGPRSAPGDALRLRGIPAVGRGVAGHVRGSHPEDCLR